MLKILNKIKKWYKDNINPVDHRVEMRGTLHARLFRSDGEIIDKGLIATEKVTNAGVNYMVDCFQSTGSLLNVFKWHDSGTSSGAESTGDTALGSAIGDARTSGSQTEEASHQYKSVATHTYATSGAIVEHGLFSASGAGTLWDRSIFAEINVTTGDSIEFTYTLTCTAGG
jgi:hypothetical protein